MPPSQHSGVYLVPRTLRDGSKRYRAKFKDPDTGRVVWETLDPVGLPNRKSRLRWLKEKSKALARRRAEISSGAPRRTSTDLDAAITDYLKRREDAGLAARTIGVYRKQLERFAVWARTLGIDRVEDLNEIHLVEFRESQETRRKRVPSEKGRRGERRAAAKLVAPQTANVTLRSVTTFLNYQRKRGRTPLLTRTEVGEALQRLREPPRKANPLWPVECEKLLSAAARHDAATFTLTRAEHRASPSAVAMNQTPRYESVAPFVAFVLLTGMRLGEARQVRWRDVHLRAKDVRGAAVGEIRVVAATSKNRTDRRVDLSVSPALRELLTVMKAQAGGKPYVFGGAKPIAESRVETTRRRLQRSFGAPAFNWQRLRRTCGSYLTCSPGIFGSTSVFRSAAQLGHSVPVAEKHYVGVLTGIPPMAQTLEAAMDVEGIIAHLIAAHGRGATRSTPTCRARSG